NSSVAVGSSVTFTASGGSGTGDYVWRSDASGTGATKTVTFNTVGTRSVTDYPASDSTHNASNTPSAPLTHTQPSPGITSPSSSQNGHPLAHSRTKRATRALSRLPPRC